MKYKVKLFSRQKHLKYTAYTFHKSINPQSNFPIQNPEALFLKKSQTTIYEYLNV